MNPNQPTNDTPHPEILTYRVQVGHVAVTVHGSSSEEAIREARRQFCIEMPRMWDVIQSLDDSQFEVAPAA